jgi:hypothetical protein
MLNRLPALAVAVGGFILYLLTSYPFPDWLDSPELITAAFRLGVFHPPGSPLAVLLGHLFSLWPFAPPATALLYFSALFAAAALYILVRTVQDLFWALGPDDQRPGTAAAVILGCAFMLCGGLWSQAIRTEVYTLALFLLLCTLRELMLLSVENEKKPRRVIRAAALCGMGLCVHPLMALTVAPAVLVLCAWRRTRNLFLAPHQLLHSAITFLLGLAPLLLIPLMVKTPLDLRWGDPTTLSGWFETVLGLTFSHSFTEVQAEGTGLVALIAVLSGLGLGISILVALGLYPLLRKRLALALVLICTGAGSMLTLALQKSVRLDNPDVSGYALPAMAALFLLAAGGLAVATRLLAGLRPKLAWITAAVAVLSLAGTAAPIDRSGCHAGRHLATHTLKSLPDKAVALVADFNLVFALEYLIQVEGLRPDVDVVYLRDLDNARMRQEMDSKLEALLPTARSLNRDSIQKIADVRPAAFDLGPHLDDSVLPMLHPHGLLWSTTLPDSPPAVAAPVCQNGSADLRSADVVAWHFYWQAKAALKLGIHDLCIARLNRAWCASPLDKTIKEMAVRLGMKSPVCGSAGPADAGRPPAPRPPLLPTLLLLLGLLAWAVPLVLRGQAWFYPVVSLTGFLCLELVLWLA